MGLHGDEATFIPMCNYCIFYICMCVPPKYILYFCVGGCIILILLYMYIVSFVMSGSVLLLRFMGKI